MKNDFQELFNRRHERQRCHPVGDTQGMSNAKPWQALEQYLGGEEAAKRYENSEGYGATKPEK